MKNGCAPNSCEARLSQFQCSHCFPSEQQELLQLAAVELKSGQFLDTAIIANGVVEEKSVVVARWFSTYVLQLSRSLN
jgi:hypothetical protein